MENPASWLLLWPGKELPIHESSAIPYIQLEVVPGKIKEPAIIAYPNQLFENLTQIDTYTKKEEQSDLLLKSIAQEQQSASIPSPKLMLKIITDANRPVILGKGALKITINMPNAPDKTAYVPAEFVRVIS